MDAILLKPIGVYRSGSLHPYEAARQPRGDDERLGEIHLKEGANFEQALIGLEGFERLWIVFLFDRNPNWKPMVRPPRGHDGKVGVLATRAPYRPNPLGLSCVRLDGIEGRVIRVRGADLLDGTPILDIKPYVPSSDAFPEARAGWLEGVESTVYNVEWSAGCERKRRYLRESGIDQIEPFARQQLEYEPFDSDRKRVEAGETGEWILAYRTWRIVFRETAPGCLTITDLRSGYSEKDLADPTDKWGDKNLHRDFPRD